MSQELDSPLGALTAHCIRRDKILSEKSNTRSPPRFEEGTLYGARDKAHDPHCRSSHAYGLALPLEDPASQNPAGPALSLE
ncbi:hypothetical protein [Streptomyces phaeoluteigriseus]|uniref:hypothetical protein n=1 Tax=Streptomyces phaeoluteigriseus TaxID=114686 RepID=UPI00117D4BFE|nr:hypothetical protein [Streptomyces phaeoluteigriseus]